MVECNGDETSADKSLQINGLTIRQIFAEWI